MAERLRTLVLRATAITAASLLVFGVSDRIGALHDLLSNFDRKTWDVAVARYRGPLFPRGVVPSEVLIIEIDDSSIAELGPFSRWPRSYHARLLRRIAAAQPRSIGFDVLMSEADRMPAAAIAEYAARMPDAAAAIRGALALSFDSALAGAIRQVGHVYLAHAQAGNRTLAPLPLLAAAACGVGHVNVEPDPDGVVRRVRSAIAGPGASIPALGVLLASDAPCAQTLPASLKRDILLDFVGPPGSLGHVSYAAVLQGRVPAELFAGRIVVVGFAATGVADLATTPFARGVPGVELHATLARQIAAGRNPHVAASRARLIMMAVLAWAVAMVVLSLSAVIALPVALLLLGINFLVACEVYRFALSWLGAGTASAPWLLAVLCASAYRFQIETRGRMALKRVFARYVAPDVVEEIARAPALVQLGGEERDITVVFIDIRGFTGIAERLSARQLTMFLNEFLGHITDIVLRNRGTLDKYIGDEVMALFGAPARLPEHAACACRAALEIRATVAARAPRWQQLGVPDVSVGIGINSGIASVGNFGSALRFDYTAIGDVVNIAARLEALNRETGTDILVGATTCAQTETFQFAAIGEYALKGKSDARPVFALLGEKTATAATTPQTALPEVHV